MRTDGKKMQVRSLSSQRGGGRIASSAEMLPQHDRTAADVRVGRVRRGLVACRTRLRSLPTRCIGGSSVRIGFRYKRLGKTTPVPTLASLTVALRVARDGLRSRELPRGAGNPGAEGRLVGGMARRVRRPPCEV
jgi:hypothetical protein